MEDAGEHLSVVGQRPRSGVGVAVRVEEFEHPVELLAERLVLVVDALLQPFDLLDQPIGSSRGLEALTQIRVAGDVEFVRLDAARPVVVADGAVGRSEPICAVRSRLATSRRYPLRCGPKFGGSLIEPDRLGEVDEILAVDLQNVLTLRDRGQPDARLAVGRRHDRDRTAEVALGHPDDRARLELRHRTTHLACRCLTPLLTVVGFAPAGASGTRRCRHTGSPPRSASPRASHACVRAGPRSARRPDRPGTGRTTG